jgi:hypothetical protein
MRYAKRVVVVAMALLALPAFPQGVSPVGQVTVSFSYKRQSVSASNQIAVWIEDERGSIVKTLYVSRFTGKGGFSRRPDSLSTWVGKAKPRSETKLDAFTGATPKDGTLSFVWDCSNSSGVPVPAGTYRYVVEGTLYWKSSVLFIGDIVVGRQALSSSAAPVYSSNDPAYRDMVTRVQAVFQPK